jgi:hypothetical protein
MTGAGGGAHRRHGAHPRSPPPPPMAQLTHHFRIAWRPLPLAPAEASSLVEGAMERPLPPHVSPAGSAPAEGTLEWADAKAAAEAGAAAGGAGGRK